MAQNRSSRSRKGKSRSSATKKPELRDPKVVDGATRQQRRADREQRREREAAASVNAPLSRMRPAGRMGAVTYAIGTYLLLAVVLLATDAAHRWNVFGYPDSMWLWLSIGLLAVVPAAGYVARTLRDVQRVVLVTTAVALGALAAEAVLGPSCAPSDCGAIGARGTLGLPLSVVLVLVLGAVSWYLGDAFFRMGSGRRPRGHVRTSVAASWATMVLTTLLVGLPILGIFLIGDTQLRPEPAFARLAIDDARDHCFDIGADPVKLALRPAPTDVADFYTTFYVRVADESRKLPALGKAKAARPLPSDLLKQARPTPYEAVVTYNRGDGGGTTDPGKLISCRLIEPGNTAAKSDVTDTPDTALSNIGLSTSNPLNANVPGTSSPTLLIQPADPKVKGSKGGSSVPGQGGGLNGFDLSSLGSNIKVG